MTVTLDSKTLNCKHIHEDFIVAHSQTNAWVSGAFKRKVKPYGVYRVWILNVVENGVAWTSSDCKSFQDSAAAGTALTFVVTDEVRVISTSVYVLGLSIDAVDLAGKNIRYYTLTLQES